MKRRTIRGQIFKSYAFLFIGLVLMAVVGINFYMGNLQRKNIDDTLTRLAFSVSEQLEAENQNLYNLAVNVCTSETLQQYFFSDNKDGFTRRKNEDAITNHVLSITGPMNRLHRLVLRSDNKDGFTRRKNEDAITNHVLSITGPMNRLHRLVLRREDGMLYEYSSREVNLKEKGSEEEYVRKNQEVLEKQGEPFFKGTFEDQEAAFLEDVPVVPVTSVQVAFSEMYGNRYTNMVEVQQPYDICRQTIEDLLKTGQNGSQYQAFVYDAAGKIVYPYKEKTERWNCFQQQILSGNESRYRDETGMRYTGKKYTSSLTGWTILVYCSNGYIFWPILHFAAVSFVIAILSLGIMLFISYMISNSITIPLQKIRESISLYNLNKEKSVRLQPSNVQLSLGIMLFISYMISNSITIPLQKIRESISLYNLNKEKSVRLQPSNVQLDEMTSLSETFYEMQERIEGYVEEVTALRIHELQSRYYALQSQMNPHFLYNSLSILSIMCDEKQNEAAAEFCGELASMLRYSAASFERDVSLEEEMEYTTTYLKLLQKRYDTMLDMEVILPESLKEKRIPRLILQPLVENSIKYGLESAPPLLQKRYDTMLDMEVILPESLKEKRIPRLILQPLVENSIKYGLESAPPWFISVEAEEKKEGWSITVSDTGNGFTKETLNEIQEKIQKTEQSEQMPVEAEEKKEGWSITVSDTGNGFTKETLNEIQEKIQKTEQSEQMPELEIGGMGILNIYIRLKLYYKERLRFLLGNQEEGGAFVEIEIQEGACERTDDQSFGCRR